MYVLHCTLLYIEVICFIEQVGLIPVAISRDVPLEPSSQMVRCSYNINISTWNSQAKKDKLNVKA